MRREGMISMIAYKQPPSLKDLVDRQQLSGKSDMDVILDYIASNNLEESAIDLINALVKSKISKLKQYKFEVQHWVPNFHTSYLYETYPLDIAGMLNRLQLDYIVNGNELSGPMIKWAQDHIPSIEIPKVYYQPLIEYLDSNGIRFKGEAPIENKVFI